MAEPLQISPRPRSTRISSPTNAAAEDNQLGLKVSKLLANSVEDVKTKAALEALSEVYQDNTETARRNLRGNVEKRSIDMNKKLLQVFEKVTEQLLLIEQEVKSINTNYDDISKRLNSANQQTALLLEQCGNLKTQRENCKMRKMLIDAFLDRFTCSEKEITILTSLDVEIGPEFFEALNHLQKIYSDCDALLITENQRAGLEIMERMNAYQEIAFDKLYKWTQTEARSLGQDNLEVSNTISLALKALRQRPTLFQYCLEDLVHIRRTAILNLFMNALTRGGPNGTPKPIESHAHDPFRYIGDMLAWVHQAVAGEHEFLQALFDVVEDNVEESLEDKHPLTSVERESDDIIIQYLLDGDLEGICRPLKTRIDQVLGLQTGAITAYRILNLIQFYKITIARILGPSAALSNALESILKSASRVFFDTLNAQAEQLLKYMQLPNNDLSAPPAVKETILQLKEIMASYDKSLVTPTEREADFSSVLDAILNPLQRMCELGAKDLSRFSQAIYMINCLYYIQSSLTQYNFTKGRIQSLEEQIGQYMDILAEEQYINLLEQSGLAPIMHAIEIKDEDTPLSLVPNMDTKSLSTAMAKLDSFLTLSDSETLRLSGQPAHLVKSVNDKVFSMFIDTYRKVTNAIKDPKNRYEFPATILVRTVNEVETLLSFD
ncbi:660_t:CDS:10 [Paraglomus brasilianum]|uniref:Conserved oligomeric Golgi complex subunit 6 n=1 Tax=Paraglomus brasilianum TaxID=144538 RepID=A0A9N9FEC7_9GLOM|nr:660_t:CDS:10 [Paraglomus brasilianum]